MFTAAAANALGIITSLVGTILLFIYGMPGRVRTDGHEPFLSVTKNQHLINMEAAYTGWGYIGLALIIIGSGLQIVGAVL